jgi:hypothetical protein
MIPSVSPLALYVTHLNTETRVSHAGGDDE